MTNLDDKGTMTRECVKFSTNSANQTYHRVNTTHFTSHFY